MGLHQLSLISSIIILTESWLKPHVNASEFGLSSYDVFRCYRQSNDLQRGGGVILAILSYLNARQLGVTSKCDTLFIEIKLNKKLYVLVAAYFPPNSETDLFNDLSRCLYEISAANVDYEFIICGDFNLRDVNWTNNPLSFQVLDYLPPAQRENVNTIHQTMSYFNLHQMYREHDHKGYTVDLLFAPPTLVEPVDLQENLLRLDMHHIAGFFQMRCALDLRCASFKESYNFTKGGYTNIVKTIQETVWDALFAGLDVNEYVEQFHTSIKNLIYKYIPKFIHKVRSFPIWFIPNLKALIGEKKLTHAKWKSSNAMRDYIEFKRLRAASIKLSRSSYKMYIEHVESSSSRHRRHFWDFVNRLKSNNRLPSSMYLNDQTASCDNGTASLFAEHFGSVYANSSLNLDDLSESDCDSLLEDFSIISNELVTTIHNLDDSPNSGPDLIPPFFVKRCLPIVKPLLDLYNKSLQSGIFPELWKSAFIYPIHKKGDKRDIVNYRPISILSCFLKMFDCIVANHISEFLLLKIVRVQQSFTKGRSTITNLLLFSNYIAKCIEESHQVHYLYIDFSKAFDSVAHKRLLQKVWIVGIRGYIHRWLGSYLNRRTQYVRIGDSMSPAISCPSGVLMVLI